MERVAALRRGKNTAARVGLEETLIRRRTLHGSRPVKLQSDVATADVLPYMLTKMILC
jgi:hypothetical protein